MLGVLFAGVALARGASPATEVSKAGAALREADAMCRRDNGALWGVSLCGPILLVDPTSRSVFANQPDRETKLKPEGQFFLGTLPDEINIANTALDWAGIRWTMIMLPLPAEKARRAALIAHEMWHRIQAEIGFPQSGAANNQLDTKDGRFWMQLEWRALAIALAAAGPSRQTAIQDAALFRARRRDLFPEATKMECDLELNEGLAEYTGVKLSGARDPAAFVVRGNLKQAPARQTFVRSFAYATGPAYGLLLDDTGADWRQLVRTGHRDLAALLLERLEITLPEKIESAANERSGKYGSVELAVAEERREQARLALVKRYRVKLVEGRVLVIPLRKMNMQFDPGNLVPLDSLGTVYPSIRIVDDWGILTVSKNGALMSSDFTRVTLPAPDKVAVPLIEGDGWTLRLNAGWSVVPADRLGDLTVRSER